MPGLSRLLPNILNLEKPAPLARAFLLCGASSSGILKLRRWQCPCQALPGAALAAVLNLPKGTCFDAFHFWLFSRSFGRRTAGALTVLLLSGLCAAGWTPAQAQASLITVASFNGSNGDEPHAGVTFDSQGNLFGTTYDGGANEVGTVYEIAKGSTTITDVAAFDQSNGDDLEAGVTFDSQGNLFGTTAMGGSDDVGTVYEIAKGSTAITNLVSFTGTNGSTPSGVTFDRQGNFFGTTQSGGTGGRGTVFEIAGASLRPAAPKPSRKAALPLRG